MSQDARSVNRRFVEEYQTKRDRSVGEELLAPDFVDHSPTPGLPPGRDGVFMLFDALHAAFPDFRAEIHTQVLENDTVATRKTFHGTHNGDFLGIRPTGKEVAFDVIDIVKVRDGKIVEHWNVVDQMTLMQQLGVAPTAATG